MTSTFKSSFTVENTAQQEVVMAPNAHFVEPYIQTELHPSKQLNNVTRKITARNACTSLSYNILNSRCAAFLGAPHLQTTTK